MMKTLLPMVLRLATPSASVPTRTPTKQTPPRLTINADPLRPAPVCAEAVQRVYWGWQSIRHPNPQVFEIHMLPLYDWGMHSFDMDCGCAPYEDCPGSIIHNSFDGREAYEPGGTRKHH